MTLLFSQLQYFEDRAGFRRSIRRFGFSQAGKNAMKVARLWLQALTNGFPSAGWVCRDDVVDFGEDQACDIWFGCHATVYGCPVRQPRCGAKMHGAVKQAVLLGEVVQVFGRCLGVVRPLIALLILRWREVLRRTKCGDVRFCKWVRLCEPGKSCAKGCEDRSRGTHWGFLGSLVYSVTVWLAGVSKSIGEDAA